MIFHNFSPQIIFYTACSELFSGGNGHMATLTSVANSNLDNPAILGKNHTFPLQDIYCLNG
jgi:hypothetical protein